MARTDALIRPGEAPLFFAAVDDFSRWADAVLDQADGHPVPAELQGPLDPQLLLDAYDLVLPRLARMDKDAAYRSLVEWRTPWDQLVGYADHVARAMLDTTPEVCEALADRLSAVSRELGRLEVVWLPGPNGPREFVTVLGDDLVNLPACPDFPPAA